MNRAGLGWDAGARRHDVFAIEFSAQLSPTTEQEFIDHRLPNRIVSMRAFAPEISSGHTARRASPRRPCPGAEWTLRPARVRVASHVARISLRRALFLPSEPRVPSLVRPFRRFEPDLGTPDPHPPSPQPTPWKVATGPSAKT